MKFSHNRENYRELQKEGEFLFLVTERVTEKGIRKSSSVFKTWNRALGKSLLKEIKIMTESDPYIFSKTRCKFSKGKSFHCMVAFYSLLLDFTSTIYFVWEA